MFTIENDFLKVRVSTKGAELQGIFNKITNLEYMWNGDPAYWGKKSPILFPIVGALKNDTYFYQNRSYHLNRHGFAREREFELEKQQKDALCMLLKSDERTLQIYPFEFELRIRYSLHENSLRVGYDIINISHNEMFFSIGGHPAFKVPLLEGTSYDDYFLEFNEDETKPRWPISREGLIELHPEPLLQQTNLLKLSKEMFFKDALVLKNPASSIVSLKTEKSSHGFDFDFTDFPYLGIWAARNADFICIEPWCGIADSVNSDQQLIHKEGIQQLLPGELFEKRWIGTFY